MRPPRRVSSSSSTRTTFSPKRPLASTFSFKMILTFTGIPHSLAMHTGKLVQIRMTPGIHRNVLPKIGPVPLSHDRGLSAQRFQALFGGGKQSRIQLVLREGLLEIVDLDTRRHHLGFVALFEHAR